MAMVTNFPEYLRDKILECPRGHQVVWCGDAAYDGCPTCRKERMEIITDEQIAALDLPDHVVAIVQHNRLHAIEDGHNAEIVKAHATRARKLLKETNEWIARNEYTTRACVQAAYEGAEALYKYHRHNAKEYATWCSSLKRHRGRDPIVLAELPAWTSYVILSDVEEARRIIAEVDREREEQEERERSE